jgi:putative SOS response-associated peptidase YedK
MCARFTLRRKLNLVLQELAELMLDDAALADWDVPPRYNVAPTQTVAAVRATADAGRRELVPLKWGLIPSWSKDPKLGVRSINARAETVAEQPMFRAAFKRRRCLVLADGYYEWTGPPKKKQPWLFHFKGDAPFAFAGLWECWRPEGQDPVESCSIITSAANELAARCHDRMPVILDPADYAGWLDPATPPDRLLPLLDCRPVDGLEVTAANPFVNNSRTEGPECVQAACE